MKPVRFSPHAEENLILREIVREDVETAIRDPSRREPARPPREMVTRSYFDKIMGKAMLIRAIIEETEDEIAVVTIYKTSKVEKYLPGGRS